MVLLDTCVIIWIANGESARLTPAARSRLEGEPWAASALSAWEIGIKSATGKLVLAASADAWWSRFVARHHVTQLEFTVPIALRAAALPLSHTDPFDRGLIATSMAQGVDLITPDTSIHEYRRSGLQIVW